MLFIGGRYSRNSHPLKSLKRESPASGRKPCLRGFMQPLGLSAVIGASALALGVPLKPQDLGVPPISPLYLVLVLFLFEE
jgi:hypothetical protein